MPAHFNSVWIFTGSQPRFPGAVFGDKELAFEWIAKHRLTETLTRYPLDVGVYDWAIERGLFSPNQDKEKSPEFIAQFTTASMEHDHFEDGGLVS